MTSPVEDRVEPSLQERVAKKLEASIADGRLAPGDPIPSERKLGAQFGVSRMTVRGALRILEGRGVVVSGGRRGTSVASQRLSAPLGVGRGFTDAMSARGLEPSSRLLETTVVLASLEMARVFDIPAGSPLFHISRVRCLGGSPVGWETAHIPGAYFPGLEKYDFSAVSLYATLRDVYGVQPVKFRQTVEAVMPTPEECDLLEASETMPVLRAVSTTATADDRAVEHVRAVWRGDRYLFTVERGYGEIEAPQPVARPP